MFPLCSVAGHRSRSTMSVRSSECVGFPHTHALQRRRSLAIAHETVHGAAALAVSRFHARPISPGSIEQEFVEAQPLVPEMTQAMTAT
jgi:hypothetical protein